MWLAALVLLSVGVGDLTRPRERHTISRALVGAAVGGIAAAAVIVLADIPWVWWLPIAAVTLAWNLVTIDLESRRALAGVLLIAGSVVLALLAPYAVTTDGGMLGGWFASLPYEVAGTVSADRAVLLTAYSLFLVQSANLVVMTVLARTDARLPVVGTRLKGGRLIGPLERLFIMWLALAGQTLAITAIIAAKSILRYPEVSGKKGSGVLAEYVLIGSLVSWALALLIVPVH